MAKCVGFVLILAIWCTGCTKDHTTRVVLTASLVQECTTCIDTFSFKKNIIPILAANCSTPGCHDFDDQAGGIELDSAAAYSYLTTTPGVVTPGNAAKSLFYTYIAPNSPQPMPQNNYPIDSCDINRIYCWIQQGALNN